MRPKNIVLLVALIAIGGAIWYIQSRKLETSLSIPAGSADIPVLPSASETLAQPMDRTALIAEKSKKYDRVKELVAPSGFINTDPFKIADAVGKKVILVDFWTYSCINCQRTLPYLNAWWEKYEDEGLLIVGVHAPEFAFEKERDNVVAAAEKFGVRYPIVQDNDYGTWNAYYNRYWPHKYLIDIDGFIVYDHIGEGSYDQTEKKIQELLAERAEALGMEMRVSGGIVAPGNVVSVNQTGVDSPEVYFGANRNTLLANGTPGRVGVQEFSAPASPVKNRLYLVGSWNIQPEHSENTKAGAKIIFRYQAKNVYMVASAAEDIGILVSVDGGPAKRLFVSESTLYELVSGLSYGEHVLEITIDRPGFKAFTFTFG